MGYVKSNANPSNDPSKLIYDHAAMHSWNGRPRKSRWHPCHARYLHAGLPLQAWRQTHTIPFKTNSNDFAGFGNYLVDSNSNFVVAIFFERFEFLVCSKFNHMQRDCTCACAVACLHPHNSVSNVVVSLTIHDHENIYINISIFMRCSKKHKTIVEGRANRSLYLGFGGERQIEQSGGWFPPQCPSRELELNNFIR